MWIVYPEDIWPTSKLITRSLIVGVLLLVITWAVFLIVGGMSPSRLSPFRWVIYAFAAAALIIPTLVLPLILFALCRAQLATLRRRTIAVLAVSTGAVIPIYLTALVMIGREVAQRGRHKEMLIFWLTVHGAVIAVWLMTAMITWPFIKRKWRFTIQEGATCPRCGYCVRGVSSRICPECGRAFSCYDLGLSWAAFDELISGKQSAASTTVSP